MSPVTALYALFNCGRAADASDVIRSLTAVRDALLAERRSDEPIVLQLVEIGEGDKGYDEWAIVRNIFKGWDIWHEGTREPTLTLGADVRPQSVKSHKVRGTAVRGQSPARPVNELVIANG
ncbi:hypothetical protein [Nocardioides sp.]|uniref:hypothetical protein n=1 Tax=Nocardioides sp. TaxID=35761 RepID=UPI003562ACC1